MLTVVGDAASVDRSGSALQVLGTPYLLDADGEVAVDEDGAPIPGLYATGNSTATVSGRTSCSIWLSE